MQEKYVAPELELAGEAGQVVLGSTRVGADLTNEILPPNMEFETDGEPSS
ncbi:MAG TPA: hypothetical protein VJN43_06275 [Bryobacteraceae bacterium]|nr:hypothetical protein [Bryobacteraceae bacterium]